MPANRSNRYLPLTQAERIGSREAERKQQVVVGPPSAEAEVRSGLAGP
jgi:hypothetical protein